MEDIKKTDAAAAVPQSEKDTLKAKYGKVFQMCIRDREISRAEVTIPEGQAESFLETGLLRVRILYLSRGYIREIEIEVGRTNVSD